MSAILNFEKAPLPLERMKALLPKAKIKYKEASPFPHIVFDDFFDLEVAEKVLSEFPSRKDIKWISSHPIAGSEVSGPLNGKENLFVNK